MVKFVFLVMWLYLKKADCWDTEQLEVFDTVDEVKVNFYTFMNISQNADVQDIKDAFRSLSLKLHPDKNVEDTSVQFRNLVSIYKVLKHPDKRKYYDEVLVNGLPSWRSAVYYYRYVRKFSIMEALMILMLLLSIGQYTVLWAIYLERKHIIAQTKKLKRNKRYQVDDEQYELQKPSVLQTLPVQINVLIWVALVKGIPQFLLLLKKFIYECFKKKPFQAEDEQVSAPIIGQKGKGPRKRNQFVLPDNSQVSQMTLSEETEPKQADGLTEYDTVTPVVGTLWTDDDFVELSRLMKKYPGGTPGGRWEAIAQVMGRGIAEVTYMASKVKENGYRSISAEDTTIDALRIKPKTKKLENNNNGDAQNWDQVQQKALELALSKYPKGSTDQRWDRIAQCVPNKTKEECITRFRYLSDSIRQRKQTTTLS